MERKNIRLAPSVYRSGNTYFFTICTFNERQVFLDATIATEIQLAVRNIHSDIHILIAYVIMPDHIHLLIQTKEGCDIISIIKLFKQKTGYWYTQKYKQPLWQKSFYDHIVRNDEGVERVVLYILNNPVRAGLVGDWRNYPYIGSGVWNRNALEGMFG